MDTSFAGPFHESLWSENSISKVSYRKCISALLTDTQANALIIAPSYKLLGKKWEVCVAESSGLGTWRNWLGIRKKYVRPQGLWK